PWLHGGTLGPRGASFQLAPEQQTQILLWRYRGGTVSRPCHVVAHLVAQSHVVARSPDRATGPTAGLLCVCSPRFVSHCSARRPTVGPGNPPPNRSHVPSRTGSRRTRQRSDPPCRDCSCGTPLRLIPCLLRTEPGRAPPQRRPPRAGRRRVAAHRSLAR